MGGRTVLVVLGTRPEAIKLFPVIQALRRETRLVTRVCVTGQHRASVDAVLALADIAPDVDLDLMVAGQGLDALTARLITQIGAVLDAEKPDFVMVQGDTVSAMMASLAAYYRRIPVAHVEAGLRSGDPHRPWPEEVNRRIIGSIAALHFAPTGRAAMALLAEGAGPASVHVTGNSGVDALLAMRERLRLVPDGAPVAAALKAGAAGRRLIAVTCHRRENWGDGLCNVVEALRILAARGDIVIVFAMHPNPELRAPAEAALAGLANVALVEPLDYPDFVALLDACHIVLTDSGGIQEEAPVLGRPVLVLRETTERSESIVAGTARLVGTDWERIVAEVARLLDDDAAWQAMARPHRPYGDGEAAGRIAGLIAQALAAR